MGVLLKNWLGFAYVGMLYHRVLVQSEMSEENINNSVDDDDINDNNHDKYDN